MTDTNAIFVARRGPAYQPDPNAVPANPVVNVSNVGEALVEVVRANPDSLAYDQGQVQDISLIYDGSERLERVEGSIDGVLATLDYTGDGKVNTITSSGGTAQLVYDQDGTLTNLNWI